MCKVAKKSDVYVDTTEQLIDSSSVGCQIYWQKPKSIIRNRDKELWKIEKDFPSDAVPSPSIATSRRFCLLFAVRCGPNEDEDDANCDLACLTRSSWPSLRPTAEARAAAAPVVLVAACEAPRRRWCRCRCSRPGATARRSTCKMRAMRGEEWVREKTKIPSYSWYRIYRSYSTTRYRGCLSHWIGLDGQRGSGTAQAQGQ